MQNTDTVISEFEWTTKELSEVQANISPGLHLDIKWLLPLDHSWGFYIWRGKRQKTKFSILIPHPCPSQEVSNPDGNTVHPELPEIFTI